MVALIDRPQFLAAGADAFYGPDKVSPAMAQWTMWIALQASPIATIETIRANAVADFRGDMASFTMPTLIIQGDLDRTPPIEIAGRKTAAAIPGSKIIEYEGAYHGLVITEKERLNKDLLEFIG